MGRLGPLLTFLFLAYFTLNLCHAQTMFSSQPKIQTQDGNLILLSAENRNISLRTLGARSYINLNGENLVVLIAEAKSVTKTMEQFRDAELVPLKSSVEELKGRAAFNTVLTRRVARLEAMHYNRSSLDGVRRRMMEFSRKVLRLTRLVRRMRADLARNECEGTPCQNGGTCEDGYNRFFCRCPPNWEGDTCATDVNECARFAGTDLGCQNGATCLNRHGSYDCQCAPGWYGLHCTRKTNDCSTGSAQELCGHGICVSQNIGGRGYTCICDQGWQIDSASGACTLDINECNSAVTPACSRSPPVQCINTPGSFFCSACPQGYSGNGYYCSDVDECMTNNGGCSLAPKVQCINTFGSFVCSSCPAGFQGDGLTCTRTSLCQINNGGCHPLARCYENPNIALNYVQCTCPPGYVGIGLGSDGCQPAVSPGTANTSLVPQGACAFNHCVNGACVPVGLDSFLCNCFPGFVGTYCNIGMGACASNPCLNGGTCVEVSGNFNCSCMSGYHGRHCEQYAQSCGGTLEQDSGELRYPSMVDETSRGGTNCVWTIKVETSKIITLNFTELHVANCQTDKLQLYDGPTMEAPLLGGNLCGPSLPGIKNTSDSALTIRLYKANAQAVNRFTLKWNANVPVCGGILNDTYGSIMSPGYPGKYPQNRHCVWHILLPTGKRILMHFITIMLESKPNCNGDYIKVQTGVAPGNMVLRQFCNTLTPLPPPFVTNSNEALVTFHSDSSGSDYGFQITYTDYPGAPGCGGIWTTPDGVLTSPNYPSNYAANQICEYLIKPVGTDRIKLIFNDFELEADSGCSYDYLELRAGATTRSPLIGRFCGSEKPANILVDGNEVLVILETDLSVHGKGFKISYESQCGGTLTAISGSLSSPNFPNEYPANKECIYEIAAPVNRKIMFRILDLDMEVSDGCRYDNIEIRDGNTQSSPLIGRFCNQIPRPILSELNHLWIRFVSDISVHHKGFFANYTTIESGECGGFLRNSTGSIIFPPPSIQRTFRKPCTFVIAAPPGHVVRLNWRSFTTAMSPPFWHNVTPHISSECNDLIESIVRVYDNSTIGGDGFLMWRYCQRNPPPSLTTLGNVMTIAINGSASVDGLQFMADYSTISTKSLCGGTYYHSAGTIRSPTNTIGGNTYPDSIDCKYIIELPTGRQVRLNITKFDLEAHTNCPYDYLEIRNGGTESSPLVGQFCGTQIPMIIISQSNRLYMRFKTDESITRGGFEISWDSALTGCGGTLKGPSGAIQSPNYPSSYMALSECFWRIDVGRGSAIRIVFIDMDLEVTRNNVCANDFLEVRDGPQSTSPLIGRFCTHDNAPVITSKRNSLWLKFRADQNVEGRGFHIRFEQVCNIMLTDYRGVIESPNFPDPYPHNRNCTWIIAATTGNKVNITFTHFQLEGSGAGGCVFDYVKISEGSGDNPPSRVIATYCGTNRPNHIITSTVNKVYIQFMSDESIPADGFRLEWVVHGCGGILTRPNGEIKTPNYPQSYQNSMECHWTINMDWGSSVQLTIHDLDTENSNNCRFDSLRLYSGTDQSTPLLSEFCGSLRKGNNVITSTSRYMLVVFKTDHSHGGRGFHGSYVAVPTVCGGLMTSSSGSIHTRNYPDSYEANDDCTWLIQVENGYRLALNFVDFDVFARNNTNCSKSFVQVYDGATENSTSLLHHCGNRLPVPAVINSTSNQLLVKMKSDSDKSSVSKGFLAEYTLLCGGRIEASSEGTIRTITNNAFEHWRNCTWTIISVDLGGHVTLTITHMDFSDFNDVCEENVLEIRDGDDLDAPLVGSYCGTKVPSHIISKGAALTVRLSVHLSMRNMDFEATYSVITGACGGQLTSESGSIASPGYPSTYPPGSECVWTINASPGNKVQLYFEMFGIEAIPNCNGDYLEIRAGQTGAAPLLGVFCGEQPPANLTSASHLWIKFHADTDGSGPGFLAHYSLDYGGELQGPNGTITNPLYPRPYGRNLQMWWRITVDFGNTIRLTFRELTFSLGECISSINIFDGYDESASSLAVVCNSDLLPAPVISSTNVVYIEGSFTSIGVGNLFVIDWLQVPKPSIRPAVRPVRPSIPGCGQTEIQNFTQNSSYEFTSPGYPYGYANQLRCEWIFKAPPTFHMALIFNTMNLEPSLECNFDYVSVYSSSSTSNDWTLLGTYCHHNATHIPIIHSSDMLKVVFITDVVNNRTGFSATAMAVCGSDIHGEKEGVIDTYNMTLRMTTAYMLWHACEYNITVRPGRTIQITFESMKLNNEGNSGCTEVYVILRNGGGRDSPPLGNGKYCGSAIPELPRTTGNKINIRLNRLRHQSIIGFRLRYEEISRQCGGTHTFHALDETRMISSPGFPHENIECEWIFLAPAGHRLRVDIQGMHPSSNYKCDVEYIDILDGGSQLAPRIKRVCIEDPGSIWSTDNAINVHYFTSAIESKLTFQAKVTVAKCGGTLRGDSGVIVDPTITDTAPVTCVWRISRPGHLFSFSITSLDITASDNCTENFIELKEEWRPVVPRLIQQRVNAVLGRFCGNSPPSSILLSSSDEVMLTYTRKSGTGISTHQQFRIIYNSTLQLCGGNINSPAGEITSPGYPNIQKSRRVCYWHLTVPEGRRINLEFLDFDLEGALPLCTQWLGVYNGPNVIRPFIKLCGSDKPSNIQSSSNKMTLQYLAWHTSDNRGFRIRFTSDLPSVCDEGLQNLSGDEGTLQFPETNMSTVYCEWIRQSVPGNQTFAITLVNGTIDANQDVACHRASQSLIIQAGTTNIGLFCKNYSINNNEATVSANWVTRFVANPLGATRIVASQSGQEKKVQFFLKYKVNHCGGILHGPSEMISSPNYGTTNYSANTDCAWSLSFPPEYTINVTISSMDIGPQCDSDFLAIYNGATQLAPLIKVFCGNTASTTPIISSSNKLFIHFHSNDAGSFKGFQLKAEAMSSGCGGNFHLPNGRIQSPHYPSQYPNNVECEWIIIVKDGYHVGLSFYMRFQLEQSDNCAKDFVEVFNNADDKWVSMGKVCGRDMPRNFNSTGNKLRVLFRSDDVISGDGFIANWGVNCGGILTANSGVIVSPNYPVNYDRNLRCNYTIVAPGKIIAYNFTDFSLEEGFQDCRYDNVSMYRNLGPTRQSHLLPSSMTFTSSHCGQNAPPPGYSPNTLTVLFQTDSWIDRRGFRMTYSVEICGGEITQSGYIRSPAGRFLQGTINKENCTWIITAPLNQVVLLRFEQFHLQSSYQCHYSYVETFEGDSVRANKSLGKLCGNLTNVLQVIKSREQKMVLTFYSEGMFRIKSSFAAAISFTYGESVGCGGRINASPSSQQFIRSYSRSPGGHYEPMQDCQWLVQALPGQTVQFSIASMNIADCNVTTIRNDSKPCSCDFLEVFDGRGQFAQRIGRYCSTNLPEPMISSGGDLWIRFVSDDVGSAAGFEGQITSVPSVCGPQLLIVTNRTQVLSSPGYPRNYPANTRCSWRLIASALQPFDLHIVDLDMESSPSCAKDSLSMSDVAFSDVFKDGFGEDFLYTGPARRPGSHTLQYAPSRTNAHVSTFCGTGASMDYYSATNEVDVTFTSDSSSGGRGFKLEYRFIGCSRNFTRQQGRIVHSWQQRAEECFSTISTEANRTIAFYFSEIFMMGGNNTCRQTGIEIRDGLSRTSPLLARLCGFQLPNPVFTTGNTASIYSWSGSNWYEEHYDITYVTTDKGRGCGGRVYNTAGSLASPLYPENRRQFSQCRWDITVPVGSLVQVKFIVFNVGPMTTCETDHVKIFDVNFETGVEIFKTRLCGEEIPELIVGTSNGMVIKYVTSVHNAGTGWTLHFGTLKKGQEITRTPRRRSYIDAGLHPPLPRTNSP